MPRFVACGGRQNAFDSFRTALAMGDGTPMLLVDAEGPVRRGEGGWDHLGSSDGVSRPPEASNDQCHLMVEIMESWFLADPVTLASFYGQGFRQQAIRPNSKVEEVPKADVLSGLEQATRATQKESYVKASHSFEILALIDPRKVEAAAPFAKRFLKALRAAS